MRSLSFLRVAAVALLLPLFAGDDAQAGLFRRQAAAPSACASGTCPAAVQYAAPVRYAAPVAPFVTPQSAAAPAAYMPDGRPLYQPVYRVPVAAPSAVARVANAVNPLAWVNAIRARHGLRALAYDANLSAYAQQNNAACSRRGLGHFVTAGCAQNAAGTSDPGYAADLWLNSPAHRATLLSPTATVAGIDHSFGYATLNVR